MNEQVQPITSNDALRFFYKELRQTKWGKPLSHLEALHVAALLAHFSQVSTAAPASSLPVPMSLSQIWTELDFLYKLSVETLKDAEIMRMAAGQSLFAVSFLSREVRKRGELECFVRLGRRFYAQASRFSGTENDRTTYERMSVNFLSWVHACRDIQPELRHMPFALN